MPIPANQISTVEIHFNGIVTSGGSTNKLIDNVFHFRRTGVALPLLKTGVETAFQANVAVPLCAALNNRFTQVSNTIRWLNDALDPPVSIPRAVVGAIAGDSMSVQMSAYIKLNTAVRGRNYRGSKHFAPLSEADTTAANEDIFNAAAVARWATFIAAFGAGFTDGQGNLWVPTVVSRALSKLRSNPTTVQANDVATISLNKKIGVMRHRSPKSIY